MAKTFEGKTVLVTGGSRGLGAAIARAFAATSPTTALNQTPFHGADGADALQGIGQQSPCIRNNDRGRLGGLRVWGSRFAVRGSRFGVLNSEF